MAGVDLIAAYRAYFSEEYDGQRRAVTEIRQQVEAALGDRAIAAVERVLDQNGAAVEFWSGYCAVTPSAMEAGTGDALRALRDATFALLDRKAAAPLDAVAPDAAFTVATDGLVRLQEAAVAYNAAVTVGNR